MTKNNPEVAVIGMGCWYPGARDLRQLWENILARRQEFRSIPAGRLSADYIDPDPSVPDKTYGGRAAVLDGFHFDWAARRIPKATYEATDIVHWLALEVALSALADAQLAAPRIPVDRTGVIVGNTLTGEFTRSNTMRLRWPFVRRALRSAGQARGFSGRGLTELEETMEGYFKSVFAPVSEDTLAGALSNTIAGRICNFLDLHGGGYTVDGACSSSLLAVATASERLASGDLDLALAGGVDVSLDTFELIGFAKAGALTRQDMNVYDRRGSGFLPGEGCGFVVLKRLADARRDNDAVLAVVRGWGISSDGKGGITAPSSKGQALALSRAYQRAGYSPRSIAFVEGHGTGTKVGDKVELEGIAEALQPGDGSPLPRSVGVTSFKSVVGHTKAAAGVGGFIKAVIAVNRRVVPSTAGCKEPHAVFDAEAQALYPVLQGEVRAPSAQMRAGVSAMGFGGINCHLTLESADAPSERLKPGLPEAVLLASAQDGELFLFDAPSTSALLARVRAVLGLSTGMSVGELVDLAAKLGHELTRQPVRAAVLASSPDALTAGLERLAQQLENAPLAEGQRFVNPSRDVWISNRVERARVGILFPGQGSQRLGMGSALAQRFGWGSALVGRADAHFGQLEEESLSARIFRPVTRAVDGAQLKDWEKKLADTQVAQPAICMTSLLWLSFLRRLGLEPAAYGGHSLGELTAFHAAGVLDEAELITLAVLRGRAMAAPAGAAGTMASLACDVATAASMLDPADGYAVLANINSPVQVVVSGERPAVEAAIRRAGGKGIQARMLPVSNAFHSRLVADAAEKLREAPLGSVGRAAERPVFSSMGGERVGPGVDLKEHFARQVLAPVDFVALVRAMAKECDLFLEVGPGRVLSGMVGDIVGADGPQAVPVESKPGEWKDLNAALAALFVHGWSLNWQLVWSERLVRPFVPASERLFIVNPCERPFQAPPVAQGSAALATGALESALAARAGVSAEALSEYLGRRTGFLADVVRSDLGSATSEAPRPAAVPAATAAAAAPVAPAGATVTPQATAEAVLLALVAARTGYPLETLDLKMRLLDDLNLDSIKAGSLVAAAAQAWGVAGKLDPAKLANAMLGDVANELRTLAGAARAPTAGPTQAEQVAAAAANTRSALEIVLEEARTLTGFAPGLVSAESSLASFGITGDKLKALVQRSAARFGTESRVDLSAFQQHTLGQLAQVLEAVGKKKSEEIAPVEPAASWVRDFAVEVVLSPMPASRQGWVVRETDRWDRAEALFLCDPEQSELGEALRMELLSRGGIGRLLSFAEAEQSHAASDPQFTHVLAVLPARPPPDAPDAMRAFARRLLAVSEPPPAEKAPRRRTTVAFIQFGGGFFGKKAGVAGHGHTSVASFAASVHHERADLRVRVVDLAPGLRPEQCVDKILDELVTGPAFAAVGYDAELTRRQLRPRLLAPHQYLGRGLSWGKSDVVLVTGGAKGITAECALAFARASGARLALLGSSPSPSSEQLKASPEVERTLERFASEGLVCRYYCCDLTAPLDVAAVVKRVREEMGPVTGVIHGAGQNHPRRIERTTADDALAELGPKVLGAQTLLRLLDDAPPKLVVAMGSIIGTVGMPGNAWYALGNESLELLVREFTARHPRTQGLVVGYSIWSQVGMGARMGAVEQLSHMGTEAIPPEEGARRFVRLVQQGTGDPLVVVTSRLGGLDTWTEDKPALEPHPRRFLEERTRYEAGVELWVRCRLSLDRDEYLRDHVYRGSHLFPTVFGLEAMAQVVSSLTGLRELTPLVLEDIRLERPIVVDPEHGALVEIRALAIEREAAQAPLRVEVGIYVEQTGFSKPHFSATFVLGVPVEQADEAPVAQTRLDIEPTSDLYGSLLFQGPSFHRIAAVGHLDSTRCVYRAESEPGKAGDPTRRESMVLGDPFLRDALLQGLQLVVPRDFCLPVNIAKWSIASAETTAATVTTILEGRQGEVYTSSVSAVTAEGKLRERLVGYRLRILNHLPENPSPEELVNPTARDRTRLEKQLGAQARGFALAAPTLAFGHLGGLHQLTQARRRELEQPLMLEAVQGALDAAGMRASTFGVGWLENGQPVIQGAGTEGVGVSLSHDDRVCLCVAGVGPQGCDVAPIQNRPWRDWAALLGNHRSAVLRQLMESGDSIDVAGTRIWAAAEAGRKALQSPDLPLTIEAREGTNVVLLAGAGAATVRVLTFPIRLTRGPDRLIAVVMGSAVAMPAPARLAIAGRP